MDYRKFLTFLQLLTLALLIFIMIANVMTFKFTKARIQSLENRVLVLEGHTRTTVYR